MNISRVNQTYQAPQKVSKTPKKSNTSNSGQVSDQVSVGNNSTQEAKVPKKWTILHYTAADNNLTRFMEKDVNEMEVVGSNENMNLISMFDKGGSDCKLYYLTPDSDMSKINSPVIQDMGNTNTADPKVLSKFISSMMDKYPAENYAVVLSDHGAGWKGAISDDTSGGFMSMPTIREALQDAQDKTGKKIDVLGFDACLMATGEVADELKDTANYMVASQETEGGNGWPYTPLLNSKALKNLDRALRTRLNISPREMAEKMVTNAQTDQYSIPTLSAMDLTKMDKYEGAVNEFAEALLNTETPNTTLKNIGRKTQSFYYSASKDQHHFADLISKSEDITDNKLKDTAKNLMKVIKEDVVIKNQHSSKYPNANGVTAEIPSWGSIGGNYKDLQFAKNTKWEESINKFSK